MEARLRRNRVAVWVLVALVAAVFETSPLLAAEPAAGVDLSDPSIKLPQDSALDPKTQAAHRLVSEIIDRVLAELGKHGVDEEAKIKAIESIVFDEFDFTTISHLVLARNYKRFSKQQRRDFEEQFKQYLSRFYGSRLVDYADEKVNVTGARLESRGDVTIMTRVVGGSADGIEMNYRVRNRKDRWKVIDVSVEGVSTVSNFRSQFREIIRHGGPDELLETLRTKTFEHSSSESGS